MGEVVLNLLSNAFKFTLDGFIRISLTYDAGRAVLKVSDSGSGIPEKDMSRIFDRFHQVDGTRGNTRRLRDRVSSGAWFHEASRRRGPCR